MTDNQPNMSHSMDLCNLFQIDMFIFIFHIILFLLQIGFLDVVIPPDFISEDTSSDVIVPEGSSVRLTCR